MTFTVLPGHAKLGDVLRDIMDAVPYDGPAMPRFNRFGDETDDELAAAVNDDHNCQAALSNWLDALQAWERARLYDLIRVIDHHQGHVTLVSDDVSLPHRAVKVEVLLHVPVSRLEFSYFEALDYRLESLRAYSGATIFVSQAVADVVRSDIKALGSADARESNPRTVRGGRPRKRDDALRAYRLAFPNGHDGFTWKQVLKVLDHEYGIVVSVDVLRGAIKDSNT